MAIKFHELLAELILLIFMVFSSGYDVYSPKMDELYHVIWQMPSSLCRVQQFDEVLHNSGITWNEDDAWHKGDFSTILYRTGYGSWPYYLYGEEPPLNGGIPQLGNLTAHLEGVRKMIENAIPNKDYHGIACINMEQFRPLFRRNWGDKTVYKTKSRELVKEQFGYLNPPDEWIETEAQRQFEYHARKYMTESLRLSSKMRPNAKWGYYNYPYCYNGNPITLHCRDGIKDGNDEMAWLWEESTAIMPSMYVNSPEHSDYRAAQYMYGNVEEGRRVADSVGGRPVYAYHKIKWNGSVPVLFYRQVTMLNGLRLPADFGIEGVILWGSSKDFKTKSDCQRAYYYVQLVVAPYVKSLIAFTNLCSKNKCSGKGRCVHRGTLNDKYADEVLRTTMEELADWTIDDRYSCRCFNGHFGSDCSSKKLTKVRGDGERTLTFSVLSFLSCCIFLLILN